MQARRRAQPSGTNSPSSSHPRLKHRARCAIFDPCPPCGRQGRPGQGFLAGSNTEEPRGSAPRERDHRGGDHPVPSRTRQLSPPSPRVLQREAAGGQGVALAEGAFLFARDASRAACRRPAGGDSPCGPSRVLGDVAVPRVGAAPPFRSPGGRLGRSAGVWHIRGMRQEWSAGEVSLVDLSASWGNRVLQRLRAFVAQAPFMRGYEIVELLKGPCRIVWDAVAGFPALADLLHDRGSRSADGRISCARGPAGGLIPSAGPFCVWGGSLACIPLN